MLPGANGARTADAKRFTASKSTDGVRHDAVFRPVPSADNVASADSGDRCGAHSKEGVLVGGGHQLSAPFAGAVWIAASHRLVLLVPPCRTVVPITFITRYDDH